MLTMLVFYDAVGNVIGTLDHLVQYDPVGLVDFEAYEQVGGRLRDICEIDIAAGAGTWPEWLDARDFTVELDPSPGPARAKIARLIHKQSGHKRERAAIEAEIVSRIAAKREAAKARGNELRAVARSEGMKAKDAQTLPDPAPEPADLRDLLGGPNKPLLLDENGRTKARVKVARPNLPVIKRA